MSRIVSHLPEVLRSLQPVLHAGVFVYAQAELDADLRAIDPLATFREDEGLTVIVGEEAAERAGLDTVFRAAWITLGVNSDLHAAGLTAAVSAALADAGISCNVVAAVHHDHLFVPIEAAEEALAVLRALQFRSEAAR